MSSLTSPYPIKNMSLTYDKKNFCMYNSEINDQNSLNKENKQYILQSFIIMY